MRIRSISLLIAATSAFAACGTSSTQQPGDNGSSNSSSNSSSTAPTNTGNPTSTSTGTAVTTATETSTGTAVTTATQTATMTQTLADGGVGTSTATVTVSMTGTVSMTSTATMTTTATMTSTTPTSPLVVTSASGAYWKTGGALTMTSSGNATVTVNDSSAMQTFAGFGGAFNEMGWSYLSTLSSGDQTAAIKALFDPVNGAHFVMGRIPMGASDYALQRYTDDETAGDTNMTSFSITRDQMYLIPYVKAALAVNPNITFWASPWTPPTWMKTTTGSVNGTNCTLVGSTMFDGGCMMDNAANLSAYGLYFAKWIKAYAGQNITISMVAPQNEPNYAQGYPSALWASALYTKFVGQYLGPALSQAGLSTQIMLGTNSNGVSTADPTVVSAVEADSTAKGLVKTIGLQWGMLDNFESNPSSFTSYGLPIWATEHKCGNYPWNPSGSPKYVEPPPNDQAYGVESWGYIRNAIKAGVDTYNAWNMVLDTTNQGKGNDTTRQWSQDALIIVTDGGPAWTCTGNAISSKLCATPAYYVFRHASQYVQPGAKVLGTSGGDAIAFKNPDGSEVVTMYNSGGANSSYTVQIKSQKMQFSMPAGGWATVFVP